MRERKPDEPRRIETTVEGDAYQVTAVTAERFEGRVLVNHPPYEFAGTVAGMNDALVSVRTHEAAGPEPGQGFVACVFLSTWDVPRAEVEALAGRWQQVLDALSQRGS